MDIYLNGILLPVPDLPFVQGRKEISSDNQTINGALYTDFMDVKRVWKMFWGQLGDGIYSDLVDIYESQFTTGDYPILQIDQFSILASVRMELNDKELRSNGDCVRNVQVTLTEQYGYLGNS